MKSHERLEDDWGERERLDRSRDRDRDRDTGREGERERERDRDRARTHRYVSGVDGVSGRRYPVEQSWR